MTNYLKSTIRDYLREDIANRDRFIRTEMLAERWNIEETEARQLALAAGALYQLPRTVIVHRERMENYMKHLYKVPSTSKIVQKEFVRIGEGSIMYSIGRHRFVEMARAAGAVYKINEGTGGTVLVSLELFDKYMDQFREVSIPLKHELWKSEEVE